MEHQIRIDEEVLAALQEMAEPFVDTPNTVLRRLLGLELPDSSDDSVHEDTSQEQVDPWNTEPDEESDFLVDRSVGPPSRPPHMMRRMTSDVMPDSGMASAMPPRTAPPPRQMPTPRTRAKRGSLLPISAYRIPILEALVELDGSAAASRVLELVEPKVADILNPADREQLESGSIRWASRAQFARLDLISDGHMRNDSPRGVWEITPTGQDLTTNTP